MSILNKIVTLSNGVGRTSNVADSILPVKELQLNGATSGNISLKAPNAVSTP